MVPFCFSLTKQFGAIPYNSMKSHWAPRFITWIIHGKLCIHAFCWKRRSRALNKFRSALPPWFLEDQDQLENTKGGGCLPLCLIPHLRQAFSPLPLSPHENWGNTSSERLIHLPKTNNWVSIWAGTWTCVYVALKPGLLDTLPTASFSPCGYKWS